jgi:cysteine desulfurase
MDIGKAVVLAKAAEDALKNQKENYEKAHTLHRFLFRELAQIPTIAINGGINNYSPYLLNFSVLGKNSETVMHYLESFDIYVATGSACSSKLKKPQATVLAMTKDEARALSSIRVSLSSENTVEELRFLLDKLKLFCPEKQ